jgi:radical SAM superfamily enzyme YgiQ (UPF0313 family)
MEIWLVQPPIGGIREDCSPPVGLLALGAALTLDGQKPHIADLNLAWKSGELDPKKSLRNQFVQALPKRSSQVQLVGITTWSYNAEVTMEFVEAIKKKHPHAPIVLGGPHATFVDRDLLENFASVDYVLRDEGDATLPRLVRAIERGSGFEEIPGLSWRRGVEVVRNASGPVVENMDGLPYPAYDLIDVRQYLGLSPVLVVEAGRGCPYNCNFCSTTNMFQRRYRVKSPGRLLDEIAWMVEKTGCRRYELLHDNLVASKKYVLELSSEIRRRMLDISWSCTSRPDNMDGELAEAMLLSGCVQVFYGVETLSEERQKWTGKRLVPALTERAVEVLGENHIAPSLGIIVGFPDESAAELDATVGAAIRWTTNPKIRAVVSTAALRFYPGADLFGQASLLRYDELAARDNVVIPGVELRAEWRTLTRVFPLSCIQTPHEETRRNILKRNFTRTLLKACPQTFRAVVMLSGVAPSQLFEDLGRRDYKFLHEHPFHDLVWNEVLLAFGKFVEALGQEIPLELLASEVPFWRTQPVVGPLEKLEHVVHEKHFDHASLLEFVQGRRSEPPAVSQGERILSIRGGRECVVWFTKEPEKTLEAFLRSYEQDRKGTLAFLSSLQRGI